MNKAQLIDDIVIRASVTKKEAGRILDAALEAIVDAVSKDKKVTLVGFGSFEARTRRGRKGRNPQTGEELEIAATVVPAFSSGKYFKDRVAS